MKKLDRTKITPPALARKWGVTAEKIRGFILAGELPAMVITPSGAKRQRFLIDLEDVKRFELRRQVVKRPVKTPAGRVPFPRKSYF